MFLAKDVAEWIEYSKTSEGFYNISAMLNTVDETEKTVITVSNSLTDINIKNSDIDIGRACHQTFLTEEGLYEVLMLSRKPLAKEFKKAGRNNLPVGSTDEKRSNT